jgi:hypothetical protein
VGCLRAIFYQIGCLVLLVALAVGAWIYRRPLLEAYRGWRSGRTAVEAWVAPASGDAARADGEIAKLARRGGPAYVDLTAADIAARLEALLAGAPRRALDSVAVSLGEDDIKVRGVVDLGAVPPSALGPLRGVVSGRQRITVGGPLSADSSGRLLWQVRSLAVGDLPLPRPAIPALLDAVRVPGADGARVPLPISGAIGDVRVTPDGVRLYRVSPR